MADFCPKCGSLLVPDKTKGKLICSCGYKTKGDRKVSEKVTVAKAGVGVFEQENVAMSKTKQDCPKCNNLEAFFWTMQTRAADEAETFFYRCCKCKHTWREYT